MPEIKLSALLDDVAQRPSTSAPSGVSLNVLQDTVEPGKQQARRFSRPIRIVAVLVVVGIAAALVTEFGFNPAARQAAAPKVRADQPVKPEARPLSPSALDPAQFSKPVQQLMEYVRCLGRGGCAFGPGLSGEEAAMQFGYSRLFASAYEEMIVQSRARKAEQKPMRSGDVVVGFEAIVAQEQKIDQLLAAKERHAAAIAYLRALQNGDVLFPGPQPLAPAPQVVLSQLESAFPGIDVDDPVFASIYRNTRDFAAARLSEAGEVVAPEVIAKFRQSIIDSSRHQDNTSIACENGVTSGELIGLTKVCVNLRLSSYARKLAEDIASEKVAQSCQKAAAADSQRRLEALGEAERAETCERAAERARSGSIKFLELAN